MPIRCHPHSDPPGSACSRALRRILQHQRYSHRQQQGTKRNLLSHILNVFAIIYNTRHPPHPLCWMLSVPVARTKPQLTIPYPECPQYYPHIQPSTTYTILDILYSGHADISELWKVTWTQNHLSTICMISSRICLRPSVSSKSSSLPRNR
jgi:hypothetical protein